MLARLTKPRHHLDQILVGKCNNILFYNLNIDKIFLKTPILSKNRNPFTDKTLDLDILKALLLFFSKHPTKVFLNTLPLQNFKHIYFKPTSHPLKMSKWCFVQQYEYGCYHDNMDIFLFIITSLFYWSNLGFIQRWRKDSGLSVDRQSQSILACVL